MKTRLRLVAAVCASALAASAAQQTELVDFANPFTGTGNSRELSNGNLYPYIAVPWGMNAWTPQTDKSGKKWFYDWKANKICGFHQTHRPSPWIGDYAQFSVMPMAGEARFGEDERASWYSHKTERATPAYCKVYLADYAITAELAPSSRAAAMRITWPDTPAPRFLVDALKGDCSVRVDASRRRVTGHSALMHVRESEKGAKVVLPKTFFVVEFDRDIVSSEIKGGYALVTFAPAKRGEKTNVRIASSFISAEQAILNLRELDGGFDAVHEAGRKAWNAALGRFSVEGGSETDRRKFCTCLYRALIFPRATHEIDAQGRIVHRSFYGKGVLPGRYCCDTGFWDTFRALFPLLNLAYPDKSREMCEGLLHCVEESGWLPEWSAPFHRNCMIGQNSASVVADAYFAGCMDDATARRLYEAMLRSANGVHPQCKSVGRVGWEEYNSIGYVPRDVFPLSASRTLEYAYADWCIWKLGAALGRPEAETALYLKRSGNWRNVFCGEVKCMRGRKRDGSWAENFNPDEWGRDFTEGSARQYNWSAMHDVPGLISAFGGRKVSGPVVRRADLVRRR